MDKHPSQSIKEWLARLRWWASLFPKEEARSILRSHINSNQLFELEFKRWMDEHPDEGAC